MVLLTKELRVKSSLSRFVLAPDVLCHGRLHGFVPLFNLSDVVFDQTLAYIMVDINYGGSMKLSSSVKPISYLKAHASRLIRDLSSHQGTLIVTHNGQAKVVLQDIHTFERTQAHNKRKHDAHSFDSAKLLSLR